MKNRTLWTAGLAAVLLLGGKTTGMAAAVPEETGAEVPAAVGETGSETAVVSQETEAEVPAAEEAGSEAAAVSEDGGVIVEDGFVSGSINLGEDSSMGDRFTDTYEGLRLVDGKWIYVRKGVKDTSKNGLVLYDNQWFYVNKGEVDTGLKGFVDYDGGQFFVADGRVCREVSGLVQDPGSKEWRFVSEGQFQKQYTGLALYDGSWFLLYEGVKNTSFSGLYDYDGEYFLIAEGQILGGYSGLFEYQGLWYFIADGQVSGYTGLAEYDGAWFYVEDGVLNSSFSGYTKYNGSWFYLENGRMKADPAMTALLAKLQTNAENSKAQAQEVLGYVNKYRSEAGAAELTLDEDLCLAAAMRAQEMADSGVLSHTRPDGSNCFTVLRQFGIDNLAAGENIASGYRDTASVCDGWYHSEGHYTNMVSSSFGKIGVGLAADSKGKLYWVQLFRD